MCVCTFLRFYCHIWKKTWSVQWQRNLTCPEYRPEWLVHWAPQDRPLSASRIWVLPILVHAAVAGPSALYYPQSWFPRATSQQHPSCWSPKNVRSNDSYTANTNAQWYCSPSIIRNPVIRTIPPLYTVLCVWLPVWSNITTTTAHQRTRSIYHNHSLYHKRNFKAIFTSWKAYLFQDVN